MKTLAKSVPLVALVALLALGSLSCRKKVTITTEPCTGPSGAPAICVKVIVKYSSAGSVNAWSMYETREVDPDLLAPELNSTPTGSVAITLESGNVVTHSGSLYYDSGTNPPPVRSGYDVLAYRPSDPSALQSFIDQYKDQATSATVAVNVMLRDISSSSSTTPVDVQASNEGDLDYVGSASASVGGIFEENKDF